MNKLVNHIIYIVTIIILVIFLVKCGSDHSTEYIRTTDTITVTKIDTAWKIKENTVYKDRWHTKYLTDTVKLASKDTFNLAYQRIYRDTIKDTNVVITTIDTIHGKLLSKSLKYKLLIPIITKNTTTTITNTIQKPILFSFKGGLYTEVDRYGFNDISPSIGLKIKKYDYIYKYNLNKQSHEIGVLVDIWSK